MTLNAFSRPRRRRVSKLWRWASLVILLLPYPVHGEGGSEGDWPQFRGGGRDGSAETGGRPLADSLPDDGIEVLWRHRVGSGFAGPVVAGDRVFVFHRQGKEAVVEALGRGDGGPVWKFRYPCRYRDDFGFDDGPRSPPTVDGDKVFTYGPEGMLHCLRTSDGTVRWKVDLSGDFGSPKGFFGRAGAPLVLGGAVIINSGGSHAGSPAGIAAFDTGTGKLLWAATDHEASYSSPVVYARPSTPPTVFFFTRRGFVGIDPADGDVLFDLFYRPKMEASVNAAAPVVCGEDRVFLSTCYGVGATLWNVSDRQRPKTLWAKEGALDCHYATPVYFDGHLFGFHGRQETGQELRCIAADSGSVRWIDDTFRAGQLIRVGNRLVILSESGELAVADADPSGFRLRFRDQVVGRPTRCVPAYSRGHVFLRGPREVVCVNLGEG